MRRMVAVISLSLIAAVLYGSFFASLPQPFSAIHLPLILILALIVTFRFPEAIAAAVTAGLVLDLLSSGIFGSNTAVMTILTLALIPLLTHVFTNRSIPGFIGINTAAFLLLHGFRLLMRTIWFWLEAYPIDLLYDSHLIGVFILGLVAHLVAAIILFAFTSVGRKTLGSIVMMH